MTSLPSIEIEETLSRTVPFRDCDVVIPRKGGGGKKTHTTGFREYTELCYKYIDSHPSGNDCESAIESTIKPLLTKGLKIYRCEKDGEEPVLVDLSNDDKIKEFAGCSTMQKLRDARKNKSSPQQNTDVTHYTKVKSGRKGYKSNQSSSTSAVNHKDQEMIVPSERLQDTIDRKRSAPQEDEDPTQQRRKIGLRGCTSNQSSPTHATQGMFHSVGDLARNVSSPTSDDQESVGVRHNDNMNNITTDIFDNPLIYIKRNDQFDEAFKNKLLNSPLGDWKTNETDPTLFEKCV